MTCHNCQIACNRFGKHRNGLQRYRCSQCRKTFTEERRRPLDEMRLPIEKAVAILQLLVEGMSLRSIERVTGVHRDTIMRVLVFAGNRCAALMDEKMRNLHIQHMQIDEIWTFVGKKNRHVRKTDSPEFGDQWVFVAMDADTKLVPWFHIGKRYREDTATFLRNLYNRITGRVQITTDGLHHYRWGVPEFFGLDADFAQLTKLFGGYGQFDSPDARYSPPRIVEVNPRFVLAIPIPSTSRPALWQGRT